MDCRGMSEVKGCSPKAAFGMTKREQLYISSDLYLCVIHQGWYRSSMSSFIRQCLQSNQIHYPHLSQLSRHDYVVARLYRRLAKWKLFTSFSSSSSRMPFVRKSKPKPMHPPPSQETHIITISTPNSISTSTPTQKLLYHHQKETQKSCSNKEERRQHQRENCNWRNE